MVWYAEAFTLTYNTVWYATLLCMVWYALLTFTYNSVVWYGVWCDMVWCGMICIYAILYSGVVRYSAL